MPSIQAPREDELLFLFLTLQMDLVPPDELIDRLDRSKQSDASTIRRALVLTKAITEEQVAALQRIVGELAKSARPPFEVLTSFAPPRDVLERLIKCEPLRELLTSFEEATRSLDGTNTRPEVTRPLTTRVHSATSTGTNHSESSEDFDLATVDDSEGTAFATFRDNARRYEILRKHAEGGLGSVSVAYDHELQRNVAFKQIKESYRHDSASQRRFMLEAEVTGQLEHPGIVPVYSLARDREGFPFYAMRFIEGESLANAISSLHRKPQKAPQKNSGHDDSSAPLVANATDKRLQSLEFRKLLGRFVDLCQAIDFAHHRGVIHRDLKPSNVMLGHYGETLVVDWGLARRLSESIDTDSSTAVPGAESPELTRPGSLIGTPMFMSPEQARGDLETLGPASDIYSLGAILYVILTGQRPFVTTNSEELLEQVRSGTFQVPKRVVENVPGALDAICTKAMANDPRARYETASQLAEDIERWLADEPVTAWREPLPVRSRRWLKRHRTFVATAAVALVAASISMIVVMTIQARTNRELTRANENERSATQEAEVQFALALTAIEEYYSNVSEDFLLGQSEFAELRESLLQGPRKFYGQLVSHLESKEQPSATQQEGLFQAHRNLGRILLDVGEESQAIEAYEQALAINQRLLEQAPQSERYLSDRIQTLSRTASTELMLGQFDQAHQRLRDADACWTVLNDIAPDSLESKRLRSTILSERAKANSMLSDRATARAQYEQAVALRNELTAALPADRDLKNAYSDLLNDYGNLLSSEGAFAESEAAFQQCIQLLTELLEHDPNSAFVTYRLASAFTNLAYVLQDQKKFDESLECYNKAVPLFRNLTEQGPNVTSFTSGLASTLNNLGLMYQSLRQLDEAESALRETMELKRRLAEKFPENLDYQVSLAGGYSNLGGVYYGLGDHSKAEDTFTQSIDLLGELRAEYPSHSTIHFFSRQAHTNRARVRRRLEMHLEAAEDFRMAAELSTEPEEKRTFVHQQAQSYALGGNHRDAANLTASLEDDATSDSDHFNLAFIYALCVSGAEQDESLDSDARSELAEGYATQAVGSLEKMFATGVVPDEVIRQLLTENEYLEPLHGYPPFEALAKSHLDDEA